MADGFHPIRGLFQSISIADLVTVAANDTDQMSSSNDEAPSDFSNLAWQAFEAVRRTARITQPAKIAIEKRIPAGAGLGGGSADAAAVIGLAGERFGLEEEDCIEIAATLGSDVPFSLQGGSAFVEGRGERLNGIPPLSGFAAAVVVPPFSLSTPAVYDKWDEMDGPEGAVVPETKLPPGLRGGPPIRNDLFPAAAALDPRVAEWQEDLARLWGVPVMMTGSGSALFALFPTSSEAVDAAAAVTLPTRLATAADPVKAGWRRVHD